MRFFSFFPSVINHDESTYLVIANSLLDGSIYLKDYIDTKPPGIFYLFALLIKIVGPNIFLMRVFGALTVAATAFLLFLAKKRQFGNYKASFLTGFLYILATSIFTYYGVSINTELYFNLFYRTRSFIIPTQQWMDLVSGWAGL